ncbi:hypothetical protein D3C72_889200 [compost metagenome]
MDAQRGAKVLGRDFGAARHADLVQHQTRRGVVGTPLLDQVDHVLGVAQGGQVRRRHDHHLVRRDQRLAHPARPEVRQVQHHEGRRRADAARHLLEGVRLDVPVAVQGGRRREQAQLVGAADHHPVQQGGVQTVRLAQGVGDAAQRVLVEVQPGGAERQVIVDDDGVDADPLAHGVGGVVGHGRGPGPAARADEGDGPPDEGLSRVGEQAADGRDQLQRLQGRHQVFTDPAPHQFAEQQDVVGRADDHHLGARVADLGQLVDLPQQGLRVLQALDHDQRRGRLGLIGLDRRRDAADADLGGGARHAPVLPRPLGGGQGVLALGEDVDGDARDRHLDRGTRTDRQRSGLRQGGREGLGHSRNLDLCNGRRRDQRRHGRRRRLGRIDQTSDRIIGLGFRLHPFVGRFVERNGEGLGDGVQDILRLSLRRPGRSVEEFIFQVETVQSVEILSSIGLGHDQFTARETRD